LNAFETASFFSLLSLLTTTKYFMLRNYVLLLLVMISSTSMAQNLTSPQEFLGYKVGTKFTQHYKIVDYFKAVASARKDMVVTETYGTTNEGRELMLAYISTPENIANLETIRNNNLRLAGLAKDKMAANTNNAPAIVWLSYNVHGNEPSSSEAAMLTLFALVDPSNTKTKEWLKNTIVIIDPCLNPDGRDRYVNWYNQVVGTTLNIDPQSSEHSEPYKVAEAIITTLI
jgi:murein tripeptide amidase MpaA